VLTEATTYESRIDYHVHLLSCIAFAHDQEIQFAGVREITRYDIDDPAWVSKGDRKFEEEINWER
jgi:hypothetical protein